MDTKSVLSRLLNSQREERYLQTKLGVDDTVELICKDSYMVYKLLEGDKVKLSPLFPFAYTEDGDRDEARFLDNYNVENRRYYHSEELKKILDYTEFNRTQDRTGSSTLCAYLCARNSVSIQTLDDLSTLDHIYLSFCTLEYHSINTREHLVGTLAAVKTKIVKDNDEYYLKGISKDIVFNKVLIHNIKEEHEIDLDYDYKDFNLKDYIEFVNTKAKPLLFNAKIANFITTTNYNVSNLIYEKREVLLKNEQDLPNSLKGINDHITLNDDALFDLNEDYGKGGPLTLPYKEMHANLNKYDVVKVNIDDKKFGEEIIKRLNEEVISKQKSILFLEPNYKLVKERRENLIKSGFSGLLAEENIDSPRYSLSQAFIKSSQVNLKQALTEEEKIKLDHFFTLRDEYVKNQEEIRKVFDLQLGDSYLVTANKASWYFAKKEHLLPVKTESYSDDDYALDQIFFSKFKKYETCYDTPFCEMPFYGLSETADQSMFPAIHDLVVKVRDYAEEYRDLIETLNCDEWGLGRISTLTDIDDLIQRLYLLNKYQGFDLKYFDLALDPTAKIKADEMREKYDDVSEHKNELLKFFKDKFFFDNHDVNQIFIDITTTKGRTRRQSKRVLKKALFRRWGYFKKVLRALPSYIEADTSLRKSMPEYEELFGYIIYDIDGIDKVDRYLSYANEFISFYYTYNQEKGFDFKSNFLVNYFENEEFRTKIREETFPSIENGLQELVKRISDCRQIFVHDDNIYEELSLNKIFTLFSIKANATYEDLVLFTRFCEDSRNVSKAFSTFFNDFNKKHYKLGTLEADFFASLFKQFSEDMYSKLPLYDLKYIEQQANYLKELYSNRELLNRYDIVTLASKRNEFINSDFFAERNRSLKFTYHYNNFPNLNKIIKALGSTYSKVLPISVETLDTITYLDGIKFDYVVVENSSLLNNEELVLSLSLAKKVIVISYSDYPEMRLNYYPLVRINFESLLGSPFTYESLFSSFTNQIEVTCNKHGYELNNNVASLNPLIPPLSISHPNRSEISHILLPDCLYSIDDVMHVEYDLRRFFLSTYETMIFNLRSMLAIFEAETSYRLLNEVYQEFLFRIKLEKLAETNKELELEKGNIRQYFERLEAIKENMPIYPNSNELDNYLNTGNFKDLIERVVPCKREFITNLGSNNLILHLDNLIKSKYLVEEKGEVTFIDKERNVLRKSNNRNIEDVLEIEFINGIRSIVSNFTFMFKDQLKELIASLLDTDVTQDNFIRKFDKAIGFLVRHKAIKVDENLISLVRN